MITKYLGERYNNRWIDMIDRMYIYGLISSNDKYVERMMIDGSSMNGFPSWVLCNLSWGQQNVLIPTMIMIILLFVVVDI